MPKNKCTLLIDGNWLLISRFSVMNKGDMFSKNKSKEFLDVSTQKLVDMMARSINVMLNKYQFIDNIILISDGGSWRKQLPIPKQLEDITYKGNRSGTKSQDVDWGSVFGSLSSLVKSCSIKNITTSSQNNIEGDDWIWYWSRRLNDDGISCIIWSSDHDLIQLVQKKGDAFTAWYNERKGINKLIFPDSMEWKEPEPGDLDFFMRPIPYKTRLVGDIESKMGNIEYVDPNTIINNKVICGDSGDNIKSVIRVNKKGRLYGVSEKDWQKISEKLKIYNIYDLINHKNDIAKELLGMKKFAGYNISIDDIIEMIDYNIHLVWLNEQIIPESVTAAMNQQEYKQIDVDYFRGSYKTLLDDDKDIMDVFESIC